MNLTIGQAVQRQPSTDLHRKQFLEVSLSLGDFFGIRTHSDELPKRTLAWQWGPLGIDRNPLQLIAI